MRHHLVALCVASLTTLTALAAEPGPSPSAPPKPGATGTFLRGGALLGTRGAAAPPLRGEGTGPKTGGPGQVGTAPSTPAPTKPPSK